MFEIKQPPEIIFGQDSSHDFHYPDNPLLITSKGAKSRGSVDHLNLSNALIFSDVESNPSLDTAKKVIQNFENESISSVIGLGGGSVLDISKYVAHFLHKRKILIPTTFGSGSEVTRISVLKVEGKKQSFHEDDYFADVAIVDPYFIKDTPDKIIKNSAIDACAQCTEAYDSLNGNLYTKFLCEKAFDILEEALLNQKYEKLPLGSLISGLGFGNSSTTLGHALSYVFSNEGISHGHALAFTTTISHKFNNSKFFKRFSKIVNNLDFTPISLKCDIDKAADQILTDKKHLDNNPTKIMKQNIIELLNLINEGKALEN